MSSGGGGDVGRGGGTDDFLAEIGGGGMLGGGGKDMVGGRVLSMDAMEDMLRSSAPRSVALRSPLLITDEALPLLADEPKDVVVSRTGDLTTLAANAKDVKVMDGLTGDVGMNWNGCAAPARWNVIVLGEGIGGGIAHSSVCIPESFVSGFGS
jgi:hypothetical protein